MGSRRRKISGESSIAPVCGDGQEKKEEEKVGWSDLPADLLGFRAIYKSWNSVSTIPRPLLLPNDSPISQSPCLAFYHNKNRSFNFFHPFSAPLRRLELSFQTPLHPIGALRCVFPPRQVPMTLVIRVTSSGYFACFMTLERGQSSWTYRRYHNRFRFDLSGSSPVLYNGIYFCLGFGGEIATYDPEDDDNDDPRYVDDRLKFPRQYQKSRETYLMESDGVVFAVSLACYGTPLRVSGEGWVEVKSLGEGYFYVSSRASESEKAVVRGTGNKIYFPKFHGNNGVFYSTSTGKYHSFVGNYASANFYGTKTMMNCTWIKFLPPESCGTDFSW